MSETSIHVLDKNREINPLEREEGYGGRIWITCRSLIRLAKSLVSFGEQVNRVLYGDQTSLYIAGRMFCVVGISIALNVFVQPSVILHLAEHPFCVETEIFSFLTLYCRC